ncbi:hypothetical protein SAY86_023998 [Trapa natans]|uniref:Uncharacterized protein n=1 Tax=Trapa natans TaxID=22666 RepID=A0AAN7RC17_TRANT|nr:hypothetical protein SAY86_023998 [Trapa natans]
MLADSNQVLELIIGIRSVDSPSGSIWVINTSMLKILRECPLPHTQVDGEDAEIPLSLQAEAYIKRQQTMLIGYGFSTPISPSH